MTFTPWTLVIRWHKFRFLRPRPDLGPGFGAQGTGTNVPVQKLEHGARIRALFPKVVFRHRPRAQALVCTRFQQCHAFCLCFTVIWSCGGNKMATPQQIKTKLRAPRCLTSFLLVPGHSVLAWAPLKSGHGLNFKCLLLINSNHAGVCNRLIFVSTQLRRSW